MANTHSIDLEASSSQYLYRADEAATSLTTTLTIEAWIKLESDPTTSQYAIVSKFSTLTNRSYMLYIGDTNKIGFTRTKTGDTSGVSVAWTPTVGAWYHVAVTYDGSGDVRFYVNGVQQGTTQTGLAAGIDDGNAAFVIGGADTTGFYFDGKIDDVRLWSSVRSSANILANIYTEIDSEANLVGSWHLNNALTDSSGNSLTLSNGNSATFVAEPPYQIVAYNDTSTITDNKQITYPISISDSFTLSDTLTRFEELKWENLTKNTSSWTNQTKS